MNRANNLIKTKGTMQKTFIGILMIIIVVVLLAFTNAHVVYMDLWLWEIQTRLSILLLITFSLGATISFLLSLPNRLNWKKTIKDKDGRLENLEEELKELKQKIKNLEKTQVSNIEFEK